MARGYAGSVRLSLPQLTEVRCCELLCAKCLIRWQVCSESYKRRTSVI